jgi:hypothetical protein
MEVICPHCTSPDLEVIELEVDIDYHKVTPCKWYCICCSKIFSLKDLNINGNSNTKEKYHS